MNKLLLSLLWSNLRGDRCLKVPINAFTWYLTAGCGSWFSINAEDLKLYDLFYLHFRVLYLCFLTTTIVEREAEALAPRSIKLFPSNKVSLLTIFTIHKNNFSSFNPWVFHIPTHRALLIKIEVSSLWLPWFRLNNLDNFLGKTPVNI